MVEIKPIKKVKGEIMLCGDKSITHRAFIFSTISNGESLIINPNRGDDTQRTLEIMEKIGSKISFEDRGIRIKGIGFDGIREPDDVLNAGNSGTTIRLLSGLFSSLKDKFFVITGDDSLRNRPMRRVVEPISLMGGLILGRDNGNYPPLAIYGRKLSGIEYDLKKPSAQVKSAIILATLNSNNKSIIIEKIKTRDHTEIMLKEFGGKIEIEDDKVVVYPVDKLYGREIYVPGDFSSASYFILLAMLLPDSEIIIKNISLNPTRTYLLEKLIENGGDTKILNERVLNGEKIGDIVVKTSFIKKIEIKKDEAPLLIDEIPLIGAIGPFLEEGVMVHGAEELRVKESDRIKVLVENLKNLGVNAEEFPDGFIVENSKNIRKNLIKTANDHRIALSFIIFGLLSKEGVALEEVESIRISFPEFFDLLKEVSYV